MSELTDVNYRDFQSSGIAEADKALLVKFMIRAKQDKQKTLTEGRPIYKDVEYIDIKVPGDRSTSVCRPASDADRQRFPEHYAAFKTRTEVDVDMGTALQEWPMISRSMAEELAFFHVKTVEQLARMSDTQCGKFMGLFAFREKAIRWLKQAEADKPLWEMDDRVGKLEQENEELRNSIKELIRAIEEDSTDTEAQKARKVKRAAKKITEDEST